MPNPMTVLPTAGASGLVNSQRAGTAHDQPPRPMATRAAAVVSVRLVRPLALHLVKNVCRRRLGRPPLICAISGPPGTGKSFAVQEVCRLMGVTLHRIAATDLESEFAGRPVKIVQSVYERAAAAAAQHGIFVAIIIDDVELALGRRLLVQATINQDLVIELLMTLCDEPESLNGAACAAVPLFLTSNNLSLVHGPLLRSGRATVVEWIPTRTELSAIVATMFPAFSTHEIESLVQRAHEAVGAAGALTATPVGLPAGRIPTPADFAALRDALLDEALWRQIQKVGLADALTTFSKYPELIDIAAPSLNEALAALPVVFGGRGRADYLSGEQTRL